MNRIPMDRHIQWWLASLGYWVAGKPKAALEVMFLQEAHQWNLAPERLAEFVRETHPVPEIRRAA